MHFLNLTEKQFAQQNYMHPLCNPFHHRADMQPMEHLLWRYNDYPTRNTIYYIVWSCYSQFLILNERKCVDDAKPVATLREYHAVSNEGWAPDACLIDESPSGLTLKSEGSLVRQIGNYEEKVNVASRGLASQGIIHPFCPGYHAIFYSTHTVQAWIGPSGRKSGGA